MRIMDLDFTPLNRASIGFDRMFDLLENGLHDAPASNYPPCNIQRTGEDSYRVTLAVAGFALEDLAITSQPNKLVVTGKRAEAGDVEYLYQGIAGRSFQREFSLADYVKVSGARLNNGLLTIELVREVPEAMQPRRVEIANSNVPREIESKAAV